MSIFYKKLINFKKKEDNASIQQRAIKVGEDYLRGWKLGDGDGAAPTISSRDAQRARAVITQEVKNIVNKMNESAEANIYNIPKRQANGGVVDENESVNLDDTNLAPNPKFNIEFAIPGEARGVGPDDKEYYEFGKLGKTVEIDFKDNQEMKEKLQVFYKIDDISDEEMRLKRTLGFTYSLKEHLSNESRTLTDLLESIRVFNSDLIKNGISCHYDQNTGLLEITFSSKDGIKEEFANLTDINSKENSEFFDKLMSEFEENSGVKNILKDYADEISDQILGEIDPATKKRLGGEFKEYMEDEETKNLVARIVDSILRKNIDNKNIDRDAVFQAVEKAVRNNFENEAKLRNDIFKLQCLRAELLKPMTGLDGILEKIFKLNIAGNIMNQFKVIADVLASSGLRVNPRELFGGIEAGMSKEDKRSVNPAVSYAHLKIEEMDRANKREFDSQKIKWERDNPGEQYPHKFKSMLQKLKESVIDQIDKQIDNKTQELQEVKNQQNDRGKMEDHLKSEFGLNEPARGAGRTV